MNWQVYSRSIGRRDAVGFVLSLGRFFVLLFIFFITTEGYAQSPGNTQRQLEAIERTFADLAQRNAYVEDLSFNEEAPVHLPLGMKRTIGKGQKASVEYSFSAQREFGGHIPVAW